MTAAELKAYLTTLTAAGSGDNVVEIAKDIVLKEGETWTSPSVDGYHGAGVITILGNGHTITGLNAPLFAGGYAGRVGIVVGTANVGQLTINNTTESGNTVSQTGKTAPEHSNLYGRAVLGQTGHLTIDGVEIK